MFQTDVEKIKTYILCSITPLPPEYCAIYEIKWKNIVELGRPQMTNGVCRPVFTHRPPGANFQGWHIKKIEIEV